MLVDHVHKLESANVSRGIELKFFGPYLMGILNTVSPHKAVGRPGPLSLPVSEALQSFLAPEPLDPLVIDGLALAPQQAVGHTSPPADLLSCDLPGVMAELCLLNVEGLAGMALGAAVLAHNPAGEPLRSPVTLPMDRDGPAPVLQAQKFPSGRSLSIAFCSSTSARSSSDGRSPSPAESATWPPRHAFRRIAADNGDTSVG